MIWNALDVMVLILILDGSLELYYIWSYVWKDLYNDSFVNFPMFHRISDSTLLQMLRNKTTISLKFSKFPCHTQAVERCVKLVTEASITVAGENAHDGLIRTKILSRSLMPSYDCKAEFRCWNGRFSPEWHSFFTTVCQLKCYCLFVILINNVILTIKRIVFGINLFNFYFLFT